MGQTGSQPGHDSPRLCTILREIGALMTVLRIVTGTRPALLKGVVLAGLMACACGPASWGQLPMPGEQQAAPNPLMDPTTKPGKVLLFDLEARFAKDVRERGGAAFADWFAEDGVALNNGQTPMIGRVAIMKGANWDPKVYQLTWTPTDAQMGPSGDMGYTWGHFEGHSKDAAGNPVTTSGRYMTIWRKQADGSWKVVLDAGANEPAAAGDCCKLPNS
jgi:ketosteroid isomerase-like protein